MWGSMYVKHVRPSRHVHGRWGSFGPIDVQGHYTHTHSTPIAFFGKHAHPHPLLLLQPRTHATAPAWGMNGLGVPVPRSERTEGQAETSRSEPDWTLHVRPLSYSPFLSLPVARRDAPPP